MFRTLLLAAFLSTCVHAQTPELKITVPAGPAPWTSLDLAPAAGQFQFAIVTDRTGGLRPGVFSEAVDKINLLRPPFVMSVGDLITGYTTDLPELERQWDEFDGLVNRLEMPFFYLPGNHDITNAVMDSLWTARYGPKYYHFVYQDVLFLCLNSEDQVRGAGRGSISDEQYAWVERTLAANADVRWTFVFLHQPLWDQPDPVRWPAVERLLRNREHSVFAGHVHHYQKFTRNNGRYYTLATTGGGSRLRGPRLGEFDHVTWVTMTDSGPVMANIALDGIHSDSVATRADYEFVRSLTASAPVRFEPLLAGAAPSRAHRVKVQFHNPADLPMRVRLDPDFSFDYLAELPVDTLTVGPNSVVDYAFDLRPRNGGSPAATGTGLPLNFHLSFDYAGRALDLPLTYRIAPQPRRELSRRSGPIVVDGNLSDWGPAAFRYGFGSGEDASVRWEATYDDERLYLAVRVRDDHVVVRRGETAWQQDYAAVVVNADPTPSSIMNTGPGWYRDSYILLASPAKEGVPTGSFYQERYEDRAADYRCVTTPEGYVLEAAIPLAYVTERQGTDWRSLRINVSIQDEDPEEEDKPRTSWQPDWRGAGNVIGSGLFLRGGR